MSTRFYFTTTDKEEAVELQALEDLFKKAKLDEEWRWSDGFLQWEIEAYFVQTSAPRFYQHLHETFGKTRLGDQQAILRHRMERLCDALGASIGFITDNYVQHEVAAMAGARVRPQIWYVSRGFDEQVTNTLRLQQGRVDKTFERIKEAVKEVKLLSPNTRYGPIFKNVAEKLSIALNRAWRIQEDIDKRKRRQSLAAGVKEKTPRYLDYRKALRDAIAPRLSLVASLRARPDEIQLLLLGALANAMIVLPKHDYSDKVLERAANATIMPLCNAQPGHHRLGYIYTNTNNITKEFAGLARDAIMTSILRDTTIQHPAEFPNLAYPHRLPIPRPLLRYAKLIQRVNLHMELPYSSSSAPAYPSPLFQAQDNLPHLKQWAPNLKTLTLEIVNLASEDKPLPSYLARRPNPGYTTLEKELEKIIDSLRQLEVKKKGICYIFSHANTEMWRSKRNGALYPKKEHRDVREEEDVEKIVRELYTGDGTEFLV